MKLDSSLGIADVDIFMLVISYFYLVSVNHAAFNGNSGFLSLVSGLRLSNEIVASFALSYNLIFTQKVCAHC